jgi:DNA-binding IclR family transcriptional regulator
MQNGQTRTSHSDHALPIASRKTGAQTLDRAVAILREIAGAADRGRRLVDLQRHVMLSKPTIHRLLKTLIRQDLVVQDASSRRYFIGPEATILALSAQKKSLSLPDAAKHDLQMLAKETGDTAFLMVRSGYDTVCVQRHFGDYPVKALTDEIGARRPLGIGAAGVVLLSALPDDEIDAILVANRERIRLYPNVSEKLIRRAVCDARSKGYSISDGNVVKAVRGLGLPIRDARGMTVAAISVAAIRERISRTRIEALVAALVRTRRVLESCMLRPPAKTAARH